MEVNGMTGVMPTVELNKNDGYYDGFGGNGWFWIILILLLGGNGWGNRCNDYYGDEFIKRDIFNTNQNVSTTAAYTQKEVLDSRYANQLGQCATDKEILENRYQTSLLASQHQAQSDRCCCELKTAIHAEGEETRALIAQLDREKLQYELNQANTAIANAVQTQNILNSLGQFYAKPAVNPYTAYNTCGCGGVAL